MPQSSSLLILALITQPRDEAGWFVPDESPSDQKSGIVVGSYKVEINKTVIESAGEKGGEKQREHQNGLTQKVRHVHNLRLDLLRNRQG